MCYLKNLEAEEHLDFDDIFKKAEQPFTEQTSVETNVLIPCHSKHLNPFWSGQQQMLIKLFEIIDKNNSLIRAIHKALAGCSQLYEKNSIQTEHSIQNVCFQSAELQKQHQQSLTTSDQNDSCCEKLFGHHNYKYFLRLVKEFPKVIYKERNFDLQVELVDSKGKPVQNFNLLSLCCAVSTVDAEWVHQNRVGQPFMKGKTQVDLYRGSAQFVKLYARDVSRPYKQGKLNLAIYAKPSALLYCGRGSQQLVVRSEEIQPLIVRDLIIKAKKMSD